MRNLDTQTEAAIANQNILIPRDFLWLVTRNRSTGAPYAWGCWSGNRTTAASVLDPFTGNAVNRTYEGGGAMVKTSAVPLATGLVTQEVTVALSILNPGAEQVVRQYDLKRAPVQIHRGFMDPNTMQLVAPARPRFVGFVDGAPIETPEEGNDGAVVVLNCVNHVQDLHRSSAEKRSDASQRRRNPTDGFFRHAATVGSWTISWGQKD
jgi:hypothetical protein